MSANHAIKLAVLIASIGIAISSAEQLVLLEDFGQGKIFTPILQTDSRLHRFKLGISTLKWFASIRFLAAVVILRLTFAILILPIVLVSSGHSLVFFLWMIVGTSVYVDWRRRIGGDGGEQMCMLVILAAAVDFTIAPPWSSGRTAAIFIAAQSCLAYLSAGVAKAVSKVWRSGNALVRILDTNTYGSAQFVRHLRMRPNLSRALNWCVIGAEISFPLVIFLPTNACIGVLTVGLIFHLVTAYVMGLNNFVWAFAATYPCIYWVAAEVIPRHELIKFHS